MSQWQQMKTRHGALSLREKILILLTLVVIVVFGLGTLVVEPGFKAVQKSRSLNKKLSRDIEQTIEQRVAIEQTLALDPKKQLQTQLHGLATKHQQLVKQLAQQQLALVSSDEMVSALQYLVAETKDLSLEKLESQTPIAILFGPQAGENEPLKPLLYRHGIKVQVQGRYFAVVDFLQKIEQQSDYLLWGDIDYIVTTYPLALVDFEVYTISTDKEFIGVK